MPSAEAWPKVVVEGHVNTVTRIEAFRCPET
jgi:hypothetical protein